ncbi:hydroxymethylbilane synthase [Actinomyces bowdenii]|uniref:Hydroxymethylbilane synthase n=1 Tax=Actinomyces bowdenii TaxID=131109 RepID=A0A3P1V5U5_9ACTO|nr:hydroxymethylbilane synthase [Actinomyces bowdenii]MBO3723601.1 hydroxymethylbilane synthase [Actinomyces bowdenii]RRD29026.1 hydroxymethylbilane synthase [Actinomyces bowdenii]
MHDRHRGRGDGERRARGRPGPGLRLGTRGSRLALTQSEQVARALEGAGGPPVSMVTVRTRGDGNRTPLRDLGGVGVFAARLRLALLDGEVDLAVHSCKDLPSAPAEGLEIICMPAREDARDALCARDGLSLEELPHGARVGTGSPRRAAQLLALRGDLEVVDLRGNVPTRLARVRGMTGALGVGRDEPVAPAVRDAEGDLDAVVLAMAGLERLGLGHCATQVLDPGGMLPAPAQGALALEARAGARQDCPALGHAAARLEDAATRLAVTAERALMASLGAGCAAPLGAWARVVEVDAEPAPGGAGSTGAAGRALELRALVCAPDGRRRVACTERAALGPACPPGGAGTVPASGPDLAAAQELGARAAAALLEDGAGRLVDLRAGRPERRG